MLSSSLGSSGYLFGVCCNCLRAILPDHVQSCISLRVIGVWELFNTLVAWQQPNLLLMVIKRPKRQIQPRRMLERTSIYLSKKGTPSCTKIEVKTLVLTMTVLQTLEVRSVLKQGTGKKAQWAQNQEPAGSDKMSSDRGGKRQREERTKSVKLPAVLMERDHDVKKN